MDVGLPVLVSRGAGPPLPLQLGGTSCFGLSRGGTSCVLPLQVIVGADGSCGLLYDPEVLDGAVAAEMADHALAFW